MYLFPHLNWSKRLLVWEITTINNINSNHNDGYNLLCAKHFALSAVGVINSMDLGDKVPDLNPRSTPTELMTLQGTECLEASIFSGLVITSMPWMFALGNK